MALPLVLGLAGLGLSAGYFGGKSYRIRKSVKDSTDPKYRDRQDAVANINDYLEASAWPDDLVDNLVVEATYAPAISAEGVYLHMLEETPVVLEDMMISPEELLSKGGKPNYQRFETWLKEAAEASGATKAALGAITPWAMVGGAISKTFEDTKKAFDPKESPWPWVAGGLALLFLLQK